MICGDKLTKSIEYRFIPTPTGLPFGFFPADPFFYHAAGKIKQGRDEGGHAFFLIMNIGLKDGRNQPEIFAGHKTLTVIQHHPGIVKQYAPLIHERGHVRLQSGHIILGQSYDYKVQIIRRSLFNP